MILLIEDDADDVFLMERAMKKANLSWPMHNAKNGQDALDYLQAKGRYSDRAAYPVPSIIFLDLKLPFIHGFDILRWIKKESSLTTVPVFMLTSSLEESDKKKARELGAQGFFIKPPTPENLLDVSKTANESSARGDAVG